MTKETLEKLLLDVETEKEKVRGVLYQLLGQITLLKSLIEDYDKSPKGENK